MREYIDTQINYLNLSTFIILFNIIYILKNKNINTGLCIIGILIGNMVIKQFITNSYKIIRNDFIAFCKKVFFNKSEAYECGSLFILSINVMLIYSIIYIIMYFIIIYEYFYKENCKLDTTIEIFFVALLILLSSLITINNISFIKYDILKNKNSLLKPSAPIDDIKDILKTIRGK